MGLPPAERKKHAKGNYFLAGCVVNLVVPNQMAMGLNTTDADNINVTVKDLELWVWAFKKSDNVVINLNPKVQNVQSCKIITRSD